MPRLILKETVKKEIDIPFETLCHVVDLLTKKEKIRLLKRLQTKPAGFFPFKKDKISSIVSDFAKTNLYEDAFIKDLEAGLKKSSSYR
jgi:hypothetical protein